MATSVDYRDWVREPRAGRKTVMIIDALLPDERVMLTLKQRRQVEHIRQTDIEEVVLKRGVEGRYMEWATEEAVAEFEQDVENYYRLPAI